MRILPVLRLVIGSATALGPSDKDYASGNVSLQFVSVAETGPIFLVAGGLYGKLNGLRWNVTTGELRRPSDLRRPGEARLDTDGQCFVEPDSQRLNCEGDGSEARHVSSEFKTFQRLRGGIPYLILDGDKQTKWLLCYSMDKEEPLRIFTTKKPDKSGCLPIDIFLVPPHKSAVKEGEGDRGGPGGDFLPDSLAADALLDFGIRSLAPAIEEVTHVRRSLKSPDSAGMVRPLRRNGRRGPMVSQSTTALPSCTAMISPTLAPEAVYVGRPNLTSLAFNEQRAAYISPVNSTLFAFTIPDGFPGLSPSPVNRTCALQFRLPYCSELPRVGNTTYPCYKFSGMEQELMANSGMYFSKILLSNSSEIVNYAGEGALVKVFPGQSTVVATFDCGAAGTRGAIGLLADSVNGFELDFIQAGGNLTFQDGVGVFIVACE